MPNRVATLETEHAIKIAAAHRQRAREQALARGISQEMIDIADKIGIDTSAGLTYEWVARHWRCDCKQREVE